MEAVRSFNNELSSLYGSKPPVSRAKMAQVTKHAIKAIKFYKHVVQSVEKFIQKCKPEYKVPGLYVIDSIVRQSRHQFGPDKDVFCPRFTKNIVATFTHLFKCPADERSRVVRVLNLWQKNSVFPVEVIQPLLDLAADPENPDLVTAAQRAVEAVVSVTQKVPLPGTHSSSNGADSSSSQILQQTEMLTTITKLLQQAQEGSISGSAPESQLLQLQHLQQQLVLQTERISKPQHQPAPAIDSNLLAQIQILTNQLLSRACESDADSSGETNKLTSGEPLFNKKLLDYDYEDSDEEDETHQHHSHHHHHQQQRQSALVQQGLPGEQNFLHQIQMSHEQLHAEMGVQDHLRRRVLEQQQQQFDREIGQVNVVGHHPQHAAGPGTDRRLEEDDMSGQENQTRADQRRHRDRSPQRRSRRSRSRSRDRRRRSRSHERHRRSRSRERQRREREKEKERKKRGLPQIRENNVSICSTTLWFGHLTKHTTEEELREHIEKYGAIRSINMIPPRGCAFVCLTKRKDAFKALDRLKGVKVNGNPMKVAWAPGIGVKGSIFKDLWDVDLGVTYIPWEQLPSDVAPLLAGGMVDEDSLPDSLKGMKTGEEDIEEPEPQQQNSAADSAAEPEEDDVMPMHDQRPPLGLPLGLPGQPSSFALAVGQGLLSLLRAGGPLGLLGAPPPLGISPGLGAGPRPPNLGALGAINNLGAALNNLGGLPGLRGPVANLLGVRPGQMNVGPQGPLAGVQGNNMGGPMTGIQGNSIGGPVAGVQGNQMGGHPMTGVQGNHMGSSVTGVQVNQMGGPMVGGQPNHLGIPSPGMDRSSPAGVTSPGPRGPFGQFNNIPRFPNLQGQPGIRPPFFSREARDVEGDGDAKMVAEPKEWPPDDEVNAEDEPDEDMLLFSDDRMMHLRDQAHMIRPSVPNVRPVGGPFGPPGPMLPGHVPPNPMFGGPRAPSPNAGMQPMLPLRMMPQGQQQSVLAAPGGPSPGFALAQRLPIGMRPGMIPTSVSPRLLPPPALSLPGSVNGPMIVGRQELPAPNDRGADSPDISSPDMPGSSDEDMMRPRLPGPMAVMQMQGGNRPPGGPFLGRGFAPMTIRPRGGPGLLGLRPGPPGNGGLRPGPPGFNRFRGPHPFRGPMFPGMDRPPFPPRFGLPFGPPRGFFDQEEREERNELRPFQRFDMGDHSRPLDEMDIIMRNSIDRRAGQRFMELRPEESKPDHKPLEWENAETAADNRSPHASSDSNPAKHDVISSPPSLSHVEKEVAAAAETEPSAATADDPEGMDAAPADDENLPAPADNSVGEGKTVVAAEEETGSSS